MFISFSLSIDMASRGGGTIKLFRFIQKTYKYIGIYPPKPNDIRSPIILKNWLVLLCEAQFFISSIAFLMFEANSMIEFGMASFMSATVLLCSVLYLVLFWEMKNILDFIGNCERFIEKSEFQILLYPNSR